MKLASRCVVLLALALGVVAAVSAPASAATPALYISTGPLAPDATIFMLGSGCPSDATVSIDVWDTAKPSSHHELNAATSAGTNGSWGYSYALANQFDPGAQIGVYASCTATVDWTWDPGSASARTKYVQTSVSDPHVSIDAPLSTAYGAAAQVVMHTDAIFGAASLTLDGTQLALDPTSVYGTWIYHLPAQLAVGSHALHATWTPQAAGSPTVTADAGTAILRRQPTLALGVSATSVRIGRTIAARVTLGSTGIAPRTGRVELRQNGRTIAGGWIRAADRGFRIFAVRFRAPGRYHLSAIYLGSTTLNRATSPTRTVRAHR